MAEDRTALERAQVSLAGARAELTVDDGRITITHHDPMGGEATRVEVGVEQVRGTHLEAPSRGTPGWLHLDVVDGSPTPPSGLAAAGDPYTITVPSRQLGAARRLAKLVERHVQARGLPHDHGPNEGRYSSGVTVTAAPRTVSSPTPRQRGEAAEHLEMLARLRACGALTDAEVARATQRISAAADGQIAQ